MSLPGSSPDASIIAPDLAAEELPCPNSPAAKPSTSLTRSFSDWFAPLARGACQQAVEAVTVQLQVMNQTLSMLEGQPFEVILHNMLEAFTVKVGEILNADRTAVFLADNARQELWSIVASTHAPHTPIEIRLPWSQGIAGEVARRRQAVNVAYDFYEDPRSRAAKTLEATTGYRTYTLLALPVLDKQGDLLAVVELLNKCRPQSSPALSLFQRIDPRGFGLQDEATFAEFAEVFQLILESSRAFYLAARRQKAATVLSKATQALNHSGLTLDSTLKWVTKEAKALLNTDRSTVWLVDRDRQRLWTQLPTAEGEEAEIHLPLGQGYMGQVADTGNVLNIPCDLYQQPDAWTTRGIDEVVGYRTYSLLCMPVFDSAGQLIAITQLSNKYRLGTTKTTATPLVGNPTVATLSPETPDLPECFQASFSNDDEFYMLAFNIHAGVAIERALLYRSLEAKVVERTQELQRKNRQLEREIEDRIKAEAALNAINCQLDQIARVDALTKVANRRQFDQHIEAEWRRMRRSQAPISVILCDIDFFKRYNDRYGHPAGDDCLRQVAAALTQEVKRPGDLLARYGGEEFVVVLPNTQVEGALHVAETLRQQVLHLAVPHETSPIHSVVTLSLGVATDIPSPPETVQGLIQQADAALYQAKNQGRNRTVVWQGG